MGGLGLNMAMGGLGLNMAMGGLGLNMAMCGLGLNMAMGGLGLNMHVGTHLTGWHSCSPFVSTLSSLYLQGQARKAGIYQIKTGHRHKHSMVFTPSKTGVPGHTIRFGLRTAQSPSRAAAQLLRGTRDFPKLWLRRHPAPDLRTPTLPCLRGRARVGIVPTSAPTAPGAPGKTW